MPPKKRSVPWRRSSAANGPGVQRAIFRPTTAASAEASSTIVPGSGTLDTVETCGAAMLMGWPPAGADSGRSRRLIQPSCRRKDRLLTRRWPDQTSESRIPNYPESPGKTATVWAWSGYTSDSLDLYYAANANSPAWVFIKTIKPTKAGHRACRPRSHFRRVHCRRFARNSDIKEVHRLAPQEPITITTT